MMKKLLIVLLGSLLSACIPMIYPTEEVSRVYALNYKNAKDKTLYDKFVLREDDFSEHLQHLQENGYDVKNILQDNGADCDQGVCYFYFLNLSSEITTDINNHQKINLRKIIFIDKIYLNKNLVRRGSIEGDNIDQDIINDYLKVINEKNLIDYMYVGSFSPRIFWAENFSQQNIYTRIENYLSK